MKILLAGIFLLYSIQDFRRPEIGSQYWKSRLIGNSKLVVTRGYSRWHNGVDLRSWDFKNKIPLPVHAPEALIIEKIGIDRFRNRYIVCYGFDTEYRLIFVHIKINNNIRIGDKIEKGDIIGYTALGGNARGHHLHFIVIKGKYINPLWYFKKVGLKYVWKYRRNNSRNK